MSQHELRPGKQSNFEFFDPPFTTIIDYTGNSMAEHSSARSLQDFNEEAFQATLRSAGNKGLQIINEMNPIKAREIFNSYSQINE